MESIEGSLLGVGSGTAGTDLITGTLSSTALDANTAFSAPISRSLLASRDDLEFVSDDLTLVNSKKRSHFSQPEPSAFIAASSLNSQLGKDSLTGIAESVPFVGSVNSDDLLAGDTRLSQADSLVQSSEPSLTSSAAISLKDDFENGNHSDEWRAGKLKTPWAFQVVNDIGTNKTNVARFEYRNTDVLKYNTTKADLAGSFVPSGTDQWFSFDFFLPKNFNTARRGPVLFQNHPSGMTEVTGKGGRPPMSMRIKNVNGVDTLQVNVSYTSDGRISDKVFSSINDIAPVVKGEWQNVLIRNRLEPNKNGKVEFYLNGKLEYKRKGVLGYEGFNTYPRIGLYQPNGKGNIEDYADKTVAYFDNIRIGPTKASVV